MKSGNSLLKKLIIKFSKRPLVYTSMANKKPAKSAEIIENGFWAQIFKLMY